MASTSQTPPATAGIANSNAKWKGRATGKIQSSGNEVTQIRVTSYSSDSEAEETVKASEESPPVKGAASYKIWRKGNLTLERIVFNGGLD